LKGENIMDKINYEELIKDAKKQTNYKWKKIVFSVSERQRAKIKELDLDSETENTILEMINYRTCMENLLINAFIKTDIDLIEL
jgi:hypothetical protein